MADHPKMMKVPCVHAPLTDAVMLCRSESDQALVVITRYGTHEPQTVFINAEGARALFNWLGVELHKGGLRS